MKDPHAPRAIRLADYRPPEYRVERVDLDVDLHEDHACVRARLEIHRQDGVPAETPLVLKGVDLVLESLSLDGEVLDASRYTLEGENLVIRDLPAHAVLEIRNRIHPQVNTSLEGLYVSRGMMCTQCEPEGFRKITFHPDRPDVMSRFTTRVEGDRSRYPLLLSNGNPVARGDLPEGRHFVVWEDPHLKPSYLFALVAGDLAVYEDRYVTASGRDVLLQIFVEPADLDKCAHAMASLKRSMRWDEDVYGREYDLDIYMIVAVSHFNMGAMENKGLNIFNTSAVLAKPETATDAAFARVEAIIAHEYFHNWSGNRVTCRDWFQLSLKEGFTVFRDQQFSADQGSATVKRIDEVNMLRTAQFAEDAGPMAHPVRPDSYIEINNFYTVTVYEKGAEVVRMIANLLGPAGFRAGCDLYFSRHDGQAVTCDDFVRAMEEASGVDLGQFRRWYAQAGTPHVSVEARHDPQQCRYFLTLRQWTPSTPGQPMEQKQPVVIPVAMGLLSAAGEPLPLVVDGQCNGETHTVLRLDAAEQTFVFEGVASPPVPSLLRGFSAPVKLLHALDEEQAICLMQHDTDGFNRWAASQQLAMAELTRFMDALSAGTTPRLAQHLAEAWGTLFDRPDLDPALLARLLELPGEAFVAEQVEQADPALIHRARRALREQLAGHLEPRLWSVLASCPVGRPYVYEPAAVAARSLRNTALSLLMATGCERAAGACLGHYDAATHMTDQMAALRALVHSDHPLRETVLSRFYAQWQHESLVVDQWFNVQATSPRASVLEDVTALLSHPAFEMTQPNKVRALIGAFATGNPAGFHRADGAGYAFLADRVLALNDLNPQIASRMVVPLTRWRRVVPALGAQMRAQLERIAARPLSPDVYEWVSKSLA